jgi:hypothetical protein
VQSQNNDLGRGMPSSVSGAAAQRRHFSALGVVDEDAAGQIGKGRRGEGMLNGIAAVKEEGPSAKVSTRGGAASWTDPLTCRPISLVYLRN